MSSQDYSPAPYPLYAENGGARRYAAVAFAQSASAIGCYGLLFAADAVHHHRGGGGHAGGFRPQPAVRSGRSFCACSLTFWRHPAALLQGLPFSLTLLTILLAHEFGHYLAAVYHRVDASLPYFMPSPLLGTFGAFIRVRSPIYSKRVLFDIGIAGPLAGFVFLLPALSIGLAFSKVIPGIAHQGSSAVRPPAAAMAAGEGDFPGRAGCPTSTCIRWRARPGSGCSATALNLLPIGQLDGGHILYSFFPKSHKTGRRKICLCGCCSPAAAARQFWWGWIVVGRAAADCWAAAIR